MDDKFMFSQKNLVEGWVRDHHFNDNHFESEGIRQCTMNSFTSRMMKNKIICRLLKSVEPVNED